MRKWNILCIIWGFNDKILVKKVIWAWNFCVRDQHATTAPAKTPVRDRIFQLNSNHASVIYQIRRIHGIFFLSFRRTPLAVLNKMLNLRGKKFGTVWKSTRENERFHVTSFLLVWISARKGQVAQMTGGRINHVRNKQLKFSSRFIINLFAFINKNKRCSLKMYCRQRKKQSVSQSPFIKILIINYPMSVPVQYDTFWWRIHGRCVAWGGGTVRPIPNL